MPKLATLRAMKKVLIQGVVAAAFTTLTGFQVAGLAAQGKPLWSIVVHFQYSDGFELDYVLERGVSAADLGDALATCGRAHAIPQVVQYHCYAVPE